MKSIMTCNSQLTFLLTVKLTYKRYYFDCQNDT
nr:MAG TPA: hypothetical protein [Caudoviricetes sp.]